MSDANNNANSFWSGLFGLGNSALSAGLNYASSRKLMRYQYALNQKALKESPSNARKGLTSAGYNPLLALPSGSQGFSASSAGIGADFSEGVNSAINSAIALKQSNAGIKKSNSETRLIEEQAQTERAKRIQMEFQNAMTDVETHLKQKDLSSYDRRLYSSLYEQMQRAENYKATSAIGQMNAQTNRMNAHTQKYSAESERMNAYSNSRNARTNSYNADTNRGKRSFGAFGFNMSFTPRNY